MVKEENKLYVCEACFLRYKDSETAQKCENWCTKYKSCNLEIIKDAIKENEENI